MGFFDSLFNPVGDLLGGGGVLDDIGILDGGIGGIFGGSGGGGLGGLFGGGGINDLLGGIFPGDPAAPTTYESTRQILSALEGGLPGLFEMLNRQILPTEDAKMTSEEAISPRQAALTLSNTQKYAPQLAAVEDQIAQARKLADAGGDLAVLRGPGRELATEATNLGKTVIDPEFFKVREAAGNKTAELLNSFNVNGLSGGERAEVERSLNADKVRSGSTRDTGVNTVSNAMTFGSALNNKRMQIGNALAQATTAAPSLRSGIDPYGKAQTNTPFTGSFQATKPTGNETFNTGNNAFNTIAGIRQQENDINANRRDSLDRVTELVGAI